MPISICGVSAAESNRALVRIVAEDPNCWAVTPTLSGTKTRELRITGSSLAGNKDTVSSSEIRADRMIAAIIEVGASTDGDLEGEFSAGTHDDLMQAFLLGGWTRSMGFDRFSGAAISWTDTDELTMTGADYRDYFAVGQRVKTEGFLEAVNNNYWTIATLAFTAGNTVITMSQTTAVAEAGGDTAKLMDANDAIVVRNTAIRLGTVAGQIDSNGGNAFAAAKAAGQLVVGQKIFVEGLGYEVGTITLSANVVDGNTVTLNDGEHTLVFEFDTGGVYTRGNIPVTIGATMADSAAALAAAVNLAYAQGKTYISAKLGIGIGVNPVDFTNHRPAQGGSLAESGANTAVTTAFAGGDAGAHGFFTVLAVADDVLTVSPAPSVDANAGSLPVTIKGSHLRNPGDADDIVKQSFTMETAFTDVGQYFVMKGLRVGGFSFSAAAGEIASIGFSLMGKDTSTRTSTLLGTAPYKPLASTATEPMNATTNVGEVRKNGVALSVAVKSLELEGDANLRAQTGVSSKYPIGIGYGSMSLSGTMECYFETLEMYDHFRNHDTVALAFDFKDAHSNCYTFSIPAVKFTADPIAPGAINTDIMESIEFAAQRDAVLKTMFMIDRFSSTIAPTA